MRKSNYDKQPSTHIDGKAVIGWDNIVQTLSKAWADEPVWAIDLYPGTYEEDFINAFAKTGRKIINTRDLMRPEEEIRQLTERLLFGYMSNIRLHEYFDNSKLINSKFKIEEPIAIIGTGAAFVAQKHSPKGGAERGLPVCYADMARWEIQQRFRRHEVKALGIDKVTSTTGTSSTATRTS